MNRTNFTTPEREKGQHLGFEKRCIDYGGCIEYTLAYMEPLPPGSRKYVRFSCR